MFRDNPGRCAACCERASSGDGQRPAERGDAIARFYHCRRGYDVRGCFSRGRLYSNGEECNILHKHKK